ncbi:MAG: ATP-binding protein [candidate division KSB1 bacterium]|nr:ATP-binding protein [candidate division KSB1 bacterium]
MKISLRNRLILTHLLLLFLVAVAGIIITAYELQRYYKSRLFEQLQTQADEIEYFLKESDFVANPHGLNDERLRGYAKAARLRLTLIDSAGVVIFDSNVPADSLSFVENHLTRPEVQLALREGFGGDERLSATVKQRMFYAAKRTSFDAANGDLLGRVRIVRLAVPLAEIERILQVLGQRVLAGGGIAFLLIALASYWISNKLTTPVQKLARVAESVKKGDLEAHFERYSEDEIGELADLLNEMVAKLRGDLRQMRKLETMRSQFLGNVSHELRTPIFAVQGYLETLLNDEVAMNEELRKKFLEKASRQAGRLNNLLTDLIDISRIESGEMKMSFHYFDVREWLAKQVADMKATAQEHNVTLILANPPAARSLMVLGDRERLGQAITNLIDNAIKYNIPGGKVEIGYKKNAAEVEIFVADTGRGIPVEHLPRIFERFYRVDKERSREVGGTGLGLAIVKHIVEAHGSEVKVKSEVGKGSVFSFSLRRRVDDA